MNFELFIASRISSSTLNKNYYSGPIINICTLDLVNKFVVANQRKRLNLLKDIETKSLEIFNIGYELFDKFDKDGDDWPAGWILQVLKKHQPQFFEKKLFNKWFNTYSDVNINYDELQFFLLEQFME